MDDCIKGRIYKIIQITKKITRDEHKEKVSIILKKCLEDLKKIIMEEISNEKSETRDESLKTDICKPKEKKKKIITEEISNEKSETPEISNEKSETPEISNEKSENIILESQNFSVSNQPIKTDNVIITKSGLSFEKKVLEFFRENYRRMEILSMTHTNSSGDIHITDDDTKTFYLIELKNKTTITKEDIQKFQNDCEKIFETKNNYHKVGIFISSVCNIPRHGELDLVQENGMTFYYMAKEYITKQIFDIIFKLTHKPQPISNLYSFDEKSMKFIIDMKEEYLKNQQEIVMFKNILKNAKETIASVSILSTNNEFRNSFIKKILIYLNLLEEDIPVSLDSLNEYIKNNKNFTKKELLNNFPQHNTYINTKTIQELKMVK